MDFPQVLNVEIYVYFSQVAYWVFFSRIIMVIEAGQRKTMLKRRM